MGGGKEQRSCVALYEHDSLPPPRWSHFPSGRIAEALTREDIRLRKDRGAGWTDDLSRDGRRILIDPDSQMSTVKPPIMVKITACRHQGDRWAGLVETLA
jgi:hypothetical protein